MRTVGPILALASLTAVLAASPAPASPATVNVRIEGKTQTLFEGPLRTAGHSIEASSDTQSRTCDGTNGGAHATPGPTPTAAAVDAMALAGQTFDGQWFSGFEDYLISRWGPDKQNNAEGENWGLLVDRTLIPKGGCQYELAEADQVLWLYDAFHKQPLLSLAAASDKSTLPSPTATAALDQPFTVKVSDYTTAEGSHEDLGPYAGAAVSPVATAANGFQSLEAASPPVTTAADGTATVTFTTPGWHRLKAAASEAFRSNRLDVCVPAEGAADCGPLPADDQVRSTEAPESPKESPPTEGDPSPKSKSDETSVVNGPGASTPAGASASGAGLLGNLESSPAKLLRLGGLVLTPLDDRAAGLTYGGQWRAASEAGAWLGTLKLGSREATLAFRLAAGRPVLIVRDVRSPARVAIVAGGRRQVFTIAGSRARTSRVIVGARRARAGVVKVRVLKGTVGLDGVALTS